MSSGEERAQRAQQRREGREGGGETPGEAPKGRRRFLGLLAQPWVWLLVGLLVLNWLLTSYVLPRPGQQRITIPYTTFKEQVLAGNVSEITSQGDRIQGTFKQAVTYPPPGQTGATGTPQGSQGSQGSLGLGGGAPAQPQTAKEFQTQLPTFGGDDLEALLEQQGVTVSAAAIQTEPPAWISILLSFGPALLIFGVLLWISSRAQQAQGNLFGIGRSRARRYDAAGTTTRITFADVAGIDEAKADLEEIVDFLRRPERYQRLGGAIPKGVLLVGAPGTGKTLLAKAVAGEAGVPFFSLSGSEFVEMIVGVGAARVRDLFAGAKKEAPAIIFIDELDAIGRRRGGLGFGGANQEQEQTLNQILTEMDGFDARQAVIVVAATNRPDVLDPALLRPGRFDRRVTVQRPDRAGRARILRVHTRGVPLAADVDLSALAGATPGLVGAELRNLVNEAALTAARRDRPAVAKADFSEAMEKIVLGAARRLVMTPADRARVAWHESGHALLGLLLPEADPVQKVTIVPRGQALGVTWQAPPDDRHNYAEADLRARIAGALGGRAAEALALGSPSTGAENDLQQATALARQMVTRWGMSPRVGPVYAAREDGGFLGQAGDMPDLGSGVSSRLAAIIDQETKRITDECYQLAEDTLRRERWRLEALATALLERESLDEEEIRQVTGLPAPPRPTAADLDGAPSGSPTGAPSGEASARGEAAHDGAAHDGAAHGGAARDGSSAAPAPPAPAPLPSA